MVFLNCQVSSPCKFATLHIWFSVEQIFWCTVMGRQTTTVRHLVSQFTGKPDWLFRSQNPLAKLCLPASLLQVCFTAALRTAGVVQNIFLAYSHGTTDYDCQTPCLAIHWQTCLAISLTNSFGKIVLTGLFAASLFHCSSTYNNLLTNLLGNFTRRILWQNFTYMFLYCKFTSLPIYLLAAV